MPFLGSIIVATVSDSRVSVYHLTATAAAAVERIICILTISYDLVINYIIFGAMHYMYILLLKKGGCLEMT